MQAIGEVLASVRAGTIKRSTEMVVVVMGEEFIKLLMRSGLMTALRVVAKSSSLRTAREIWGTSTMKVKSLIEWEVMRSQGFCLIEALLGIGFLFHIFDIINRWRTTLAD